MNFKQSTLQHETLRYMERAFIAPPEGVVLKTDQERILWRQYTNARRPSDWREVDLIMLARIIRLEVKELQLLDELEEVGDLVTTRHGELKQHPLWIVLRNVAAMKRNIITNMGIGYYRDSSSVPKSALGMNALGAAVVEQEGLPFLAN